MMPVVATILAVAEELATWAKDNMPKLFTGEYIVEEEFKNGIYTRKTILDGRTYISQYDFRQKAVRRMEKGKKGKWQPLK